MKIACAVLISLWLTSWCHGAVKLSDQSTVVFATAEQGRKILQTPDDFVTRLSPFDRSARLKTDKPVSQREFLDFVGRSVLAWTPQEKQRMNEILAPLQKKLQPLHLPLPDQVYLIKTTGREEGGADYTRSNAIILPKSLLSLDATSMQRQFCHELFHVLSRANPELRGRLYRIIGFEPCGEISLSDELKKRKITNPDAPQISHCIRIKVDSANRWAVPILLSRTKKYDIRRGGEFFDYIDFQFLLVERDKKLGKAGIVLDDKKAPRLVPPQKTSGYIEQVGRNTGYVIHPEEILADNFAILVLGPRRVPSPGIIDQMKSILSEQDKKPRKR